MFDTKKTIQELYLQKENSLNKSVEDLRTEEQQERNRLEQTLRELQQQQADIKIKYAAHTTALGKEKTLLQQRQQRLGRLFNNWQRICDDIAKQRPSSPILSKVDDDEAYQRLHEVTAFYWQRRRGIIYQLQSEIEGTPDEFCQQMGKDTEWTKLEQQLVVNFHQNCIPQMKQRYEKEYKWSRQKAKPSFIDFIREQIGRGYTRTDVAMIENRYTSGTLLERYSPITLKMNDLVSESQEKICNRLMKEGEYNLIVCTSTADLYSTFMKKAARDCLLELMLRR